MLKSGFSGSVLANVTPVLIAGSCSKSGGEDSARAQAVSPATIAALNSRSGRPQRRELSGAAVLTLPRRPNAIPWSPPLPPGGTHHNLFPGAGPGNWYTGAVLRSQAGADHPPRRGPNDVT